MSASLGFIVSEAHIW